jgi:hypothetical protein
MFIINKNQRQMPKGMPPPNANKN